MEAIREDASGEVVFRTNRPMIGLVFELESEPKIIHSIDYDADRWRVREWIRSDPMREAMFGLVCDAILLTDADVPGAAEATD
jgi:hypothetical protein